MSLTLRFSGSGRRTSSFLILVRLGGLWEEKKENTYSIYNLLWGKQLVRGKTFCTRIRAKKGKYNEPKNGQKSRQKFHSWKLFLPLHR